MVIGIPKALLYYKYSHLWEGFFDSLGVEYVQSPDTNRDILSRGMSLAVDESCLSFKTYMGHVDWLTDRCDMIFVPRVSNFGRPGTVCTRFQALYDIVKNTLRDRDIALLHYNYDQSAKENEIVLREDSGI
jgi:predicted nucleotide-binding protein (sugar kinase/HSP70/actin superfamily)